RDRNPHPRAGGSGEDHGPRRALGTTGRQSMPQALAQRTVDARSARRARGFPPEASILLVLIGLALTFELLGWILVRQSFLLNEQRLVVMILQVSVIGIIAVGVTQVIITGGIDLSSGSVVAVTAMVAASLAQSSDAVRAVYPSLTDLPVLVPVMAGLAVGAAAGVLNGTLIAGINVAGHLIVVYTIAGALSGLAGIVTSARAVSGQAGMGMMYELDAIAAAVIGGASLSGGIGRITGTVIGTLILGVVTSGFTFLRIDAYYQEIVKGAIIVAAVIADQYRHRAGGRRA